MQNQEIGLIGAQDLPVSEQLTLLPENQQEIEKVEKQAESKHASKFRQAMHVAKRAVQGTVIALEVSPANEAVRYGAFVGALAKSDNPLVGAMVLGGSTLVVEGAAALATADIISSENGTKTINWLNNKLEKYVPKDAKMPPIAEAGVALYGGTVVVMAEKQRENPSRTVEQNRRHGLFTASWLAGVLAVEGALVANGVEDYHDPKSVGIALIAVAGLATAVKWAKDKIKKESPDTSARYDLGQEELFELERGLVSEVEERFKEEGIYAIWVQPDNKYANIIRAYESQYFPEVATVSDEEEENTLFLALVDSRAAASRVVHGATISGVRPADSNQEMSGKNPHGRTGFIVVDDLIEMGNFSSQDFYDYYAERGIDVDKCLSCETNFRIGKKTELFNGFTPAQLAYTTIFNKLKDAQPKEGKAAVFASINRASILSFQRVGLKYEYLMGRDNLKTPEQELGKEFVPVAILYNDQNIAIFDHLGHRLPELNL